MKIFLTSIGTRGDIEPFLALGENLSKKGHEVVFAFPQQFATITPQAFRFYPLSPKFIELIQSKQGRIVMGSSHFFRKIKSLVYLYQKGLNLNGELIQEQNHSIEKENPDLVIHNAKCIYPTLWSLRTKKPTILLSPVPYFMYPVKNHAHVGYGQNLGSFLNNLTYKLSNFGLIKTTYDAQKHLAQGYCFSKLQIRQTLMRKKLMFTIATSLFKRPDYWPNHVQVLGYHERDKVISWQPDDKLKDFLEQYPKIIFLSFGSMVNSHPQRYSEILYHALSELKIPTLINTAENGLIELDNFKDHKQFLFVNNIPYKWIFKRVYAVIHHGGSGTTHAALKYGCPSLILPHIIDQYAWNNLIYKLGLGPKGKPIYKITLDNIIVLIEDLYYNEKYRLKTKNLAIQMSNENSEDRIYDFISKI